MIIKTSDCSERRCGKNIHITSAAHIHENQDAGGVICVG